MLSSQATVEDAVCRSWLGCALKQSCEFKLSHEYSLAVQCEALPRGVCCCGIAAEDAILWNNAAVIKSLLGLLVL